MTSNHCRRRKRLEVITPIDGTTVGSIPAAGIDDVKKAVKAARKAHQEGVWGKLPGSKRAEVLRNIAAEVQSLQCQTSLPCSYLWHLQFGKLSRLMADHGVFLIVLCPENVSVVDEVGISCQSNDLIGIRLCSESSVQAYCTGQEAQERALAV